MVRPVPKQILICTLYKGCEWEDGQVYPSGDYQAVEVWFDHEKIVTFGDAYHDQGLLKATTYIRGASYAWKVGLGIDAPEPIHKDWWPAMEDLV